MTSPCVVQGAKLRPDSLKRGFGSAPTGIKKWVKWLAVGFVVYVAVRFACAFVGGVVTNITRSQ